VTLFKRHQRAPLPDGRLAQWQAEDDHLAELIAEARGFRGLPAPAPITLHARERVFIIAPNVELIEPRSAGGHWQGRTQGVSVHVPGSRSMRYRVGASKGHYVREADKPTAIDTGTAVVTDRRVVFTGPKQTREWHWDKVIAVEHEPDSPWTAIPVENRTKVSGIAYSAAEAPEIRFRLDLAHALATGATDGLVGELEADRAEHASHRPGAPLPPPGAPLPPPRPV